MFFTKKYQKGQTLLEGVVALAVSAIIITSITVVVVRALANAQYSKTQNQATQYAQQGMEIVRNIRETDWATFDNLRNNTYCMAESCTTLSTAVGNACGPSSAVAGRCTTQNVGLFIRQVDIDRTSGDCSSGGGVNQTKVIVSVKWSDGKCNDSTNLFCHEAKQESCLSNSRIVPEP